MKKIQIRTILFILFLLVVPSFIAFYSSKIAKADTLGPMNKYGYKISIMSYSGSGEATMVGKPILVYQPGLLDTVIKTIKGNYPAGYGTEAFRQIMSIEFGCRQFIPNNLPEGTQLASIPITEEAGSGRLTGNDAITAGGPNNGQAQMSATNQMWVDENSSLVDAGDEGKSVAEVYIRDKADSGEVVNDLTFQDAKTAAANYNNIARDRDNTDKKYNYYEKVPAGRSGCPGVVDKRYADKANTTKKIRRYMTNERKIVYLGSNIDLSEYYEKYEDTGTPYEMVIKYASNTDLVSKYFGITLNPMDLKNYYIQVEVVQRALEYEVGKLKLAGQYFIKDISSYDRDSSGNERRPTEWNDTSDWDFIEQICPSGYDVINSSIPSDESGVSNNCRSCKSCPSGYDLTNASSCVCSKTTTITNKTTNCMPASVCTTIGNSSNSVKTRNVGKCSSSNLINCEITSTSNSTDDISVGEDRTSSHPTFRLNKKCEIGVLDIAKLYGTLASGPSYIVSAREYEGADANPAFFLEKAKNTCSTPENTHCILAEDGETCTGKYLYYVGPNIENALVGPSTVDPTDGRVSGKAYKYRLNDARWNGSEYTCGGGVTGSGVQHYYFLEIYMNNGGLQNCQTECLKVSSDKRSDEYLKCAEQIAENLVDYDTKGNTRKRKLKLLIDEDKCSYSYGESPRNGDRGATDRESRDSCNNSSRIGVVGQYNALAKTLNIESRCNITDGKNTKEQKATYVTECKGDEITDFDGEDSNDKIFDQRTYVNEICKETSSFEFKDTSILNLAKGTGFTYPVIQNGEKECTYFINLEQWKFDYASAPARDPLLRKRLLYLLDAFNGQVSNTAKNDYYDGEFKDEGYGDTGYNQNGYDFGKTTVTTKTKEKIATTSDIVQSNNKFEIGKSTTSGDNVIEDEINKTGSNMSVVANEAVTIIENGNIGSKSVNRYISTGAGKITYTLEKVCISTDGLATVEKNPTSEVCHEIKINNKTEEVLAESKYYTSFQIKAGEKNEIGATATVGKNAKADGDVYYKAEEKCTYAVSEKEGCKLRIEPVEGRKLGNKQYEAGSLKVTIHYDLKQSEINNVSITDNGTTYSAEEITVGKKANRSVTVHLLEGKIELKNGTVLTCQETVDQYSQNGCGAGCRIDKVEDTVYKIVSTGSVGASNYYTYTSGHAIPTKDVLSANNNIPYQFMKPVYKSVTDSERYIRLSEKLGKDEILFGYVTTSSDGTCNNYCATNMPDKNDCYKLFKPAETREINEYCKKNWTSDANGFDDEEDCYKKCTVICPNNKQDKTSLEKYCKNNYENLGFPDEEHCMNKCYKDELDLDNDNYLFRAINVMDPFPNSSESEPPYEKGKRIVGKNWQFLTEYLTNDSEDETSITGSFKNMKVEYVIDLTSQDIREIRNDTKENEINTTTNKRKVYAQLDRLKTSDSNTITEYKSKFLNNSKFTKLFKTNHGNIPASFIPGAE